MRVTSSMMARTNLRNMSQGLARLQETQGQITSGKDFTRPSEDPGRATSAMSTRKDLRRIDQRMRSIEDAQGWVGAADTQLTSALDRMLRAKEIAVNAGNGIAALTPGARASLAKELRAVRSDLLNVANATYAGRSLFAGTAAGVAYDGTGAFMGNEQAVIRDVAPSNAMTINVNGSHVFGKSGVGAGTLFEVLERMAVAVEAGDRVNAAAEQGNLDVAFERMRVASAEIGTKWATLEQLAVRTQDDKVALKEQLSQMEDVDMVESLIKVKSQESSYQAALQTTAKVLPMSLLDFLR
jgi:flagellar hook-associated protein 3 FlgL